jgi:hypothetical protein
MMQPPTVEEYRLQRRSKPVDGFDIEVAVAAICDAHEEFGVISSQKILEMGANALAAVLFGIELGMRIMHARQLRDRSEEVSSGKDS